MITVKSVLAKSSIERTAADNDTLVKHLLQTKFAHQIKLKEKDCREIIVGMKLQESQPNKNIVTYGEQGEHFYILFSGSASVWVPAT